MKKGKWTEIFTRRHDVIHDEMELSDGKLHGQGWACTCGCNKRVPHRKHSEGPPRELCDNGYVPTTGGTSEAYRNNYSKIKWNSSGSKDKN